MTDETEKNRRKTVLLLEKEPPDGRLPQIHFRGFWLRERIGDSLYRFQPAQGSLFLDSNTGLYLVEVGPDVPVELSAPVNTDDLN